MVYFIICLFVIIKSNSKIPIVLLDFFHDTSVNDELINCSQYSFYHSKLPFIPDFVNQCVFTHIRCKSIPLILCTRYLSKLLVGSHFHHLDLQFLLIRLSFLSATTPVSCYYQSLSFSVSMSNSFLTVTCSPSSLFTSSIQGIFGVLFFFSHIPPQNLKNLSISGILLSLLLSPSNVLKKSYWSRWNLTLSCFLFLFHFSILTFLYLN